MASPHMEMPPPSFRPWHDPAFSPVGPFEPPPPFLHGVDHHLRPNYSYSYGNEWQGYGGRWTSESGGNRYQGEFDEFEVGLAKVNDQRGSYDPVNMGKPFSGSSCAEKCMFPRFILYVIAAYHPVIISLETSGAGNATVEIVIPQPLLGCIYGENKSNTGHIEQLSGAKVAIHDPVKEGGRVVLSGTSDEIHTAQCLVHALILCDKHRFGL